MTHDDFVYLWNSGCSQSNEEQTDDVLRELMSMIAKTMLESCGSIHNFEFEGNKGHIKLIGGIYEEH